MEDSNAKTIDFLRARLLAERSVSRTARQRANELAKKVTELEKQLKFVSLQRKKAEKATVDVLAILENHGRTDISEPFDSSSDHEEISRDFNDGSHLEPSGNMKVPESDDTEGFSGSEVESSSVNGRSLSWKSSKNSSNRFVDKKYMDASRRRRNSLASTGSSPRRAGKSCRQIRHREHRSVADVSQNDDATNGHHHERHTSSEGVQNSADVATENSLEEPNTHEEKDPLEVSTCSYNGHAVQNYATERDMERALEHQAQFEAQEKAQRDWEDKFRANNGSPMDSLDPGTHSDLTEEQDEIKAPPPPLPPGATDKLTTGNQQIDAKLIEKPKTDTEPVPGPPRNIDPYEPTFGSREKPDNLKSVLEALKQAKLSLKQNLDKFPLLENGPNDNFSLPFTSASLFGLPTDYEHGGTTQTPRVNSLTFDRRLSLTNCPVDPSGSQLISNPYRDSLSRSASSLDDRFRMVPTFPYQEITLDVPKLPLSVHDPRLDVGMGPSARDPRLGVGPSTLDPRLDMGPRLSVGPSAIDQRLGVGPRLSVGPSAIDQRLGVGPSTLDPRLDMGPRLGVGPSAIDQRLGVGPSAIDPILDMGPRLGVGPSALDPRLGVGQFAFDPRLETGAPFTSDRYTRGVDRVHSSAGLPPYSIYGSLPRGEIHLRTRSLYDDYTRPNTYE